MSTMTALTARIVQPGGGFYASRLQRVVRLPDSHCAVVCEGCEFFVRFPIRLGVDQADRVRREHLLRVHHDELVSGRMALSGDDS